MTAEQGRSHDERSRELLGRLNGVLLRRISDGVITTDLDFNIHSLNPSAAMMFGWDELDVVGKSFHGVANLEYHRTTREDVNSSILNRGFWNGEATHRARGGEQKFLNASATLIRSSTNDPIGVVIIARDVTEHRIAERTIREREQILRDLTDLLPALVVQVGLDGDITFVNQKGPRLIGYDTEEFIHLRPLDHFLSQDGRDLADLIKFVCANRKTIGEEFVAKHKNGGSFPMFISAAPAFRDGAVAGAAFVGVDLTERKAGQLALRSTEEKYSNIELVGAEGIVIASSSGEILYMNPPAKTMLGMTTYSIRGGNVSDFLVIETLDELVSRSKNNTLAPGGSLGVKLVLQNGQKRAANIMIRHLSGGSDDDSGLFILIRNVTESY